ncbi:hypothetical protein HOY82DRAFT_491523, partial [Tuber indicum]
LNLSYPEATIDISFIRTNPQPFHTLSKSPPPGQFTPTAAHALILQTERACCMGASP